MNSTRAFRRARQGPVAAMSVNNIPACSARLKTEWDWRPAGLPDEPESGLVQLMTHAVTPTLDCYLVYPEP